jgi:hypothetical protein
MGKLKKESMERLQSWNGWLASLVEKVLHLAELALL